MNNKKREFIAKKVEDLINNATQSEISFARLLEYFDITYDFQYPIENKKKDKVYIVDFVTFRHKKKIVFEIDGDYHLKKDQFLKDKDRDIQLKKMKYEVHRFSNFMVHNEKFEVLKQLRDIFINPVDKFKKKIVKDSQEDKNQKKNKQNKKVVKYYGPKKVKKFKNKEPKRNIIKTDHADKLLDLKKQREERRAQNKTTLTRYKPN